MGTYKNITGQIYGRLTAIKPAGKEAQGQQKWLCVCTCGNEIVATGRNLRNGHTQSCGCLKHEKAFKHGHNTSTKSVEYVTWDSMIQRCTNPKSRTYQRYGAVGIKVCERWLDFVNFYADMGDRPSSSHSLDRYPDYNGNYEPTNCRWATNKEQARNKKNNIWIEYDGKKLVAADWARITGISFPTIVRRIRLGVPVEDALTLKPIKGVKTKLNKEQKNKSHDRNDN